MKTCQHEDVRDVSREKSPEALQHWITQVCQDCGAERVALADVLPDGTVTGLRGALPWVGGKKAFGVGEMTVGHLKELLARYDDELHVMQYEGSAYYFIDSAYEVEVVEAENGGYVAYEQEYDDNDEPIPANTTRVIAIEASG